MIDLGKVRNYYIACGVTVCVNVVCSVSVVTCKEYRLFVFAAEVLVDHYGNREEKVIFAEKSRALAATAKRISEYR